MTLEKTAGPCFHRATLLPGPLSPACYLELACRWRPDSLRGT